MNCHPNSIVVVGGGTAGWMTAVALSKMVGRTCSIQLVESDDIGTIGVGEATIPGIRAFNAAVGVQEDEFLAATSGTFKLGIEFVDWFHRGSSYVHGFGRLGHDRNGLPFHQYWLRERLAGRAAELGEYSLNIRAALQNRFLRPLESMVGSPLGEIAYAYHFDASLYAALMRKLAEAAGVTRIEGRVIEVVRDPVDGRLASINLEHGRKVSGDFFIDCSGQRSLLLGEALGVKFEDWSNWLPCDRAVAMPSSGSGNPPPYTRSTARDHGWQWRIPLQHREGNGYVYSSRYCSDDEATALLRGNIIGEALAEPRTIPFRIGRREIFWSRNCLAIGLSAGFLEPLESTSIHLIQSSINRLRALFPAGRDMTAEAAEFNAQTAREYEEIRDFIILHYHLTARRDSPFWRDSADRPIPGRLKRRIALYQSSGRIFRDGNELFAEPSWLQVLNGQGLMPVAHDPLVEQLGDNEIRSMLSDIHSVIGKCVLHMPTHGDFIANHCAMLPRAGGGAIVQ